jgi:putative DNA primase/helicase
MISAAEIAQTLGGAYRSGPWWCCRCPVHDSQGATLAVRDGEWGLDAKCFGGCSRADILADLRRRGLVGHGTGREACPDPAETARRREAEARDRQRRIALARDMIAASLPTAGTSVERYLRTRIPGIAEVPSVIRYIPMCDVYARHRSGSRRPVMVAAVEQVQHGVVGAQRTWLTLDGSGKASLDPVRKFTGPVGGGAVRLAPAGELLLVGEGVETVLSAMIPTKLPGWAALSDGGIEALILPATVKEVLILADHDLSGAGERATRAAAARWLAEDRRVRIAMPPLPGSRF